MIHTVSALDAQPADWPAPLIDLLERQQTLVDRLADLARSQAGLIAERRTDRLLELLAQRQSIIDEFTASQRQMSTMTERLDQRLAGIGALERDRIRMLIDSIGDRLGEVMHSDQHDQTSLRTGRDQVREELQGVGAARAAHNAYASNPATHSESRFADRKG